VWGQKRTVDVAPDPDPLPDFHSARLTARSLVDIPIIFIGSWPTENLLVAPSQEGAIVVLTLGRSIGNLQPHDEGCCGVGKVRLDLQEMRGRTFAQLTSAATFGIVACSNFASSISEAA